MSNISGEGFGYKHHWIKGETECHGPGERNVFTNWQCKDCKAYFRHFYKDYEESDIFEKIKQSGIKEICPEFKE